VTEYLLAEGDDVVAFESLDALVESVEADDVRTARYTVVGSDGVWGTLILLGRRGAPRVAFAPTAPETPSPALLLAMRRWK